MLLTCCFREDKTKKGDRVGTPISSSSYPKGGSIEDVVVVVPVPERKDKIKQKEIIKSSKNKKNKKGKHKKENNEDDIDGLNDVHKTTQVVAELHVQESANKNNRHSVCSNGSEILRSNSLASRQSSIQSNFKSLNGPNRDGSDRRDRKEKAPMQREQKRLYKQKSQESSLQVTNGIHLNASTATSANASSIPFIDQSPTTYLPQSAPGQESKTGSAINPSENMISRQGTHITSSSLQPSSIPVPSSSVHHPNQGTNTISSVIYSPSNSSSASYYTNTPSHQLSSVSSNYDGQSATHSANNTRRPNRNHATTTARSTPNLPTSTPIHNPSSNFVNHSNIPILKSQNAQVKQNHPNADPYPGTNISTSSASQTSSSINYHVQMGNREITRQNQTFLSSTTISSTSAVSVAAGRDPFTGNFSRQLSPTSPPPLGNNKNSSSQLANVEEKVSGRGITRSSASYGIQKLLQDQINQEEKENVQRQTEKQIQVEVSKVTSSYEQKLSSMKAEHEAALKQLQKEKEMELSNARNNFETELKRKVSEAQKNIVIENSKSSEMEIRKIKEKYEQEFKAKEEAQVEVCKNYQQRDQAWQSEKQDVLSEIQRLKEEANRYLRLLSQEEENNDDQLSPTKKQSLTKEVESLQLVVEMRTNELHRLREERELHLRQLEDLESNKASLLKMTARVEDLQAQLDEKIRMERQLSMEKSYLENNYELEGKAKDRMSMQVEELQWRIKNNLELPPTRVFSPTTDDDRVIATLSVASTPGKPPVKMSPFSALEPSNKIRSRSVSDHKQSISKSSFVETGAPPDVIQLRKEEIFDPILNKNEESEKSNRCNENDSQDYQESDLCKKQEDFVARISDDRKIITNAKVSDSMMDHPNETVKTVSFDNNSYNSNTRKNSSRSGNIIQQSKLPRPTTIGSLKNPHLPASNSNIAIHTDQSSNGNLNLETSKIKTISLNDTNITFEGVHFSVASPDRQKHLKEEHVHIANSQNLKEKGRRLEIENHPKLNKNQAKIEDDNANLSDEGIIIGDVNSNANSEASNSPLPPVSSNTDQLGIDDNKYLNPKLDVNVKLNEKSDKEEDDVNCNSSVVSSEQNNELYDLKPGNHKQESLSNKCIQNSINSNNNDKNRNNNEANVSTPSMSSPCDDRVPSRIPLSVE